MIKKCFLILLPILFLAFCSEDDNDESIENSGGFGKLTISTDSKVYTWQNGESEDMIILQGSLTNETDSIYYTSMGDYYSSDEQFQLFVACNSSANIEKYRKNDKSWYEVEICSYLIEGSKYIALNPSVIYSISGHLRKDKNTSEAGIYRIRVDYYDKNVLKTPYRDYSNIFEIQ